MKRFVISLMALVSVILVACTPVAVPKDVVVGDTSVTPVVEVVPAAAPVPPVVVETLVVPLNNSAK